MSTRKFTIQPSQVEYNVPQFVHRDIDAWRITRQTNANEAPSTVGSLLYNEVLSRPVENFVAISCPTLGERRQMVSLGIVWRTLYVPVAFINRGPCIPRDAEHVYPWRNANHANMLRVHRRISIIIARSLFSLLLFILSLSLFISLKVIRSLSRSVYLAFFL